MSSITKRPHILVDKMIADNHSYVYRSGVMMALAIMFLMFFSVGLAALALLGTGMLASSPAAFLAAAGGTALSGIAAWNMEIEIQMRSDGLRFVHLIKPAYTIGYSRIQRVSVRMLRGMYYCFMRFGPGLLNGTFFPVRYWTHSGKEETNEFLTLLAEYANLKQIGKTPLGAPIYERSYEGR